VTRLDELVPADRIADFASRWQIIELSLFCSVLRDDFAAESDIDVLVSFDLTATWSLWDLTTMQDELTGIVGRKVDLVEKEGLRNPIRRRHILTTRKIIYVRPQGWLCFPLEYVDRNACYAEISGLLRSQSRLTW